MMATTRGSRERHEWTAVPAVGVAVHARVWDGPAGATPVVLVSGLGVSGRYWVRLGRRLGGRFRVLAPDLPGFGRTRRPPGVGRACGPSPAEQAVQLLAWMDARDLGRVALVGHSVGCHTAVELATRWPDRVERVVLAAPPFEPGRRSLAVCLPRLAWAAAFEVPSLPPLLVADYLTTGVARAVQQAWRSMDDPVEAKLPKVEVPALVIHGRRDPLVSRAWAGRVAGGLPRGSLVEVARAGHAMHYSAAAVTAGVIGDFLNGRAELDQPTDDPRHDPLGPPQPIPPGLHALIDGVAAVAAVVLPHALRWGRPTRRVLTVAAAVSAGLNALTDRGRTPGRLPMATHAAVDLAGGVVLLTVSATTLRRHPPAARWAVAGWGMMLIAGAVLTAKPTGPATACRGRPVRV